MTVPAAYESSFEPEGGHEPQAERWFESAADLLMEDDPGPTPFLVESLIVEGSIAAIVGPPKKGKTWTLLDLAKPGPVLLILEESGRAALHRRLDKLARGRAIAAERLCELYVAANRRVRLDHDEWRGRLLEAGRERSWRLIAFDPLARVKGLVDENVQREVGPVLDFLRELRSESSAAVAYVHHTPHDGTRHRGSSDFESYWESKLTLIEHDGKRELRADHREAEGAGPFVVAFGFDNLTETLRLQASGDELEERVREYLDEHPEASANEVDAALGANRKRVLELVRIIRSGGSESPEPPGTTLLQTSSSGGVVPGPLKGAPGEPPAVHDEVVPRTGSELEPPVSTARSSTSSVLSQDDELEELVRRLHP